ncbi:MAG: TetR/AcrR family transcriptional regulator [Smithellaceae bacterium]
MGTIRKNRKGNNMNISRESILREAAKLFREKGYRATNLSIVASKFKVSRQAIYHYFGNKKDILIAVHEDVAKKLYPRASEIFNMSIPAERKMAILLKHHIIIAATNTNAYGIIFQEEGEFPKKYLNEVKAVRLKYNNLMVEVYRQGIKEKKFVDIPPEIAVFNLLGVCNWTYRWFRKSGALSDEQIADLSVKMMSNGYLRR